MVKAVLLDRYPANSAGQEVPDDDLVSGARTMHTADLGEIYNEQNGQGQVPYPRQHESSRL